MSKVSPYLAAVPDTLRGRARRFSETCKVYLRFKPPPPPPHAACSRCCWRLAGLAEPQGTTPRVAQGLYCAVCLPSMNLPRFSRKSCRQHTPSPHALSVYISPRPRPPTSLANPVIRTWRLLFEKWRSGSCRAFSPSRSVEAASPSATSRGSGS